MTAIASDISKEKIKSFCIGFEDPQFDESKITNKYAQILKTQHKEIICKPTDILEMIPN